MSWILIVAATLLTALRDIRATYPNPKVSTLLVAELVASLFYPFVAAGDLGAKLADRSKDWSAIRTVLTPPFGWVFHGLGDGSSDSRHPDWDAPPSPALMSQCMGLVLPLTIVQIGTIFVFFMYFSCFLFHGRRRGAYQLGFLASGVAFILMTLVATSVATTDSFGYILEFLLYIYISSATLFLVPFCTIPICLICPCVSYFCFSTLLLECRRALRRRPYRRDISRRALKQGMKRLAIIVACFWVGLVGLSGPITMVCVVLPELLRGGSMANVPYSLSELDQWAALCSGAITLAFSAYEAIPWKVLVSGYVDIWRMLTAATWKKPTHAHVKIGEIPEA